jgi:hypothetical protein
MAAVSSNGAHPMGRRPRRRTFEDAGFGHRGPRQQDKCARNGAYPRRLAVWVGGLPDGANRTPHRRRRASRTGAYSTPRQRSSRVVPDARFGHGRRCGAGRGLSATATRSRPSRPMLRTGPWCSITSSWPNTHVVRPLVRCAGCRDLAAAWPDLVARITLFDPAPGGPLAAPPPPTPVLPRRRRS